MKKSILVILILLMAAACNKSPIRNQTSTQNTNEIQATNELRSSKSPEKPTNTPSSSQTNSINSNTNKATNIDTSKWEVYSNQTYMFEFKYPSYFDVSGTNTDGTAGSTFINGFSLTDYNRMLADLGTLPDLQEGLRQQWLNAVTNKNKYGVGTNCSMLVTAIKRNDKTCTVLNADPFTIKTTFGNKGILGYAVIYYLYTDKFEIAFTGTTDDKRNADIETALSTFKFLK